MKICMIFNVPPEELTTHIEELVVNLANLGIEVHLVVPETKVKKHKNIKAYFVKRTKFPWLIKIGLQAISSFKVYFQKIQIHGVSLVYVRSLHFAFSLMPLVIMKKVKLIYEINGLVGDEFASKRKWGKYLKPLIDMIETFTWRNAISVIAVTQGIKENLVQRGIDTHKIHVIENGANTELFKPVEKNKIKEIKTSLGLNHYTRIIAFVGRLYPWQGLEYLIMSAPEIIAAFPETCFLIVGDGLSRIKLENLIHTMELDKYFKITGMLPYERVPEYINISDICVAPFIEKRNQNIGLSPLKMCEYLSCEKPVVASRIKGLEFLEENNCGLLVKPDDSQALADAILRLLKDNDLRDKMGKNGRKYVVSNRSWEQVVKKVAVVIEQVSNSSIN